MMAACYAFIREAVAIVYIKAHLGGNDSLNQVLQLDISQL